MHIKNTYTAHICPACRAIGGSTAAVLAHGVLAGQYSPVNQERTQALALPNSVALFTAWAAKHKEVLAIEDRWNLAVQHNLAAAGAIQQELESARGDAQRMLAQAQSRFNEEQRARGTRD